MMLLHISSNPSIMTEIILSIPSLTTEPVMGKELQIKVSKLSALELR